MRFKIGDPVWAMSEFSRGFKAAEIAPKCHIHINRRHYAIRVFGVIGTCGCNLFAAYEWQLFPRFDNSEKPLLQTTIENLVSA